MTCGNDVRSRVELRAVVRLHRVQATPVVHGSIEPDTALVFEHELAAE
jgi:hypothetical protein